MRKLKKETMGFMVKKVPDFVAKNHTKIKFEWRKNLAIIAVLAMVVPYFSMPIVAKASMASFAASKDTYVDQNHDNINYGDNNSLKVSSEKNSKNQRTLIAFDLSSIPAGSTVSSAVLKLYVNGAPADLRQHEAHLITSSWTENGATWNNSPTYSSTVTDSVSVGPSENHTVLSWNVTSDVITFVNGTQTNYGWLIKDSSEDASHTEESIYASKDQSTNSKPELVVIYTAPVKTDPTIHVTNSPVTYNGSAQAATVTGSVSGTVSNIKYDGSSTVPTNVGTYAVTADFVPTDTTLYNSLTNAPAGNFVINKAGSVTNIGCPVSQTYTGSPIEPCTATYSGVGGLSGVVIPTYSNNTATGTATAMASFGGDSNHDGSSSSTTFQIVDVAVITYTLTYTAGTGGTISGVSPQTVVKDTDGSQVVAVADPGYHFTNWSDGVLTATRTDANIQADLSVTANFAFNSYTLTYTANSNGSITGSSTQVVLYGANGLAVTAVPDSGYHFTAWSDGVTTAVRTETNVQSDITVSASFAADSTGGGGGGADVADPGIVKTLDNATPAPGATIVYTLTATNNGNAMATGVVITDPLPSSVTYVSNDGGAGYDATTTAVTWNVGDLAAGASAILHITATVKSDATGSVGNTATVTTTGGGNSNPDNDSSTASGTITVPSSGGGTTSGGGGSTSSGGSGIPVPPPVPQIAGAFTSVPSASLQMPEGQVLGASTELPRTGTEPMVVVLAMSAAAALLNKKLKLV